MESGIQLTTRFSSIGSKDKLSRCEETMAKISLHKESCCTKELNNIIGLCTHLPRPVILLAYKKPITYRIILSLKNWSSYCEEEIKIYIFSNMDQNLGRLVVADPGL